MGIYRLSEIRHALAQIGQRGSGPLRFPNFGYIHYRADDLMFGGSHLSCGVGT